MIAYDDAVFDCLFVNKKETASLMNRNCVLLVQWTQWILGCSKHGSKQKEAALHGNINLYSIKVIYSKLITLSEYSKNRVNQPGQVSGAYLHSL